AEPALSLSTERRELCDQSAAPDRTCYTSSPMPVLTEAFRFLDPGPLIDHELELVLSEPRWIKPMWQSIRHPLTQKLSPKDAALTREAVAKFVHQCPSGRQPPNPDKNLVAQYHFWMRLRPIRGYVPPTPMAG